MTTSAVTRSAAPLLASAGNRTVHASAATALREAILTGDLPAGTRLVQADVAAALGVSVTPVREALRELAGEGLVDVDAFRGAVVHTPTLPEMEEIYAMRTALVPLAVQQSVRTVGQEQLRRAEQLCDAMAECDDAATWSQMNRSLHRLLEGGAGPHLTHVLARLADISLVYVNLSVAHRTSAPRRADADQDHRALLAAYVARDAVGAGEIAVAHLARTIRSVRRAFTQDTPDGGTPAQEEQP